MVNPTFSLGIYAFPNLSAFLRNVPNNFVGLTPEAQFDRYWRFTLFGLYAQDEVRLNTAPHRQRRPALRSRRRCRPIATAATRRCPISPRRRRPSGRSTRTRPTRTSRRAPASRGIVFGDGRTSVRGGYGLYFNTNNQQNLIVTVTNPPFTPRPVIVNPTFPNPPFERAGAISIRPDPVRPREPAGPRLQRQRAARGLGPHGGDGRLRRQPRPPPAAQQRRQHRAAGRSRRTARPSSRPARRARTPRSRRSS